MVLISTAKSNETHKETSTRDSTPIIASWYQAIECLIRKYFLDYLSYWDYETTSNKIFGEESPPAIVSLPSKELPICKACCLVFQATTCDVLCLGYTPFRAAMRVLWYNRNFCLVSSKKQPKILTTAAFWTLYKVQVCEDPLRMWILCTLCLWCQTIVMSILCWTSEVYFQLCPTLK